MNKTCCIIALAIVLGLAARHSDACLNAGPGATLLFPYFEVDLDDPDGRTTLASIGNASAVPTLVHAVLWTDWGLPTYGFDLYLDGEEVRSLNLRHVFAGGPPPLGGDGAPAE